MKVPKSLKKFHKTFMLVTTSIVNFILLSLVYFIGVGLTSIIAKVLGKSFLDLGKKNKKSYWVTKEESKKKLEEYYKQF
jgi:hypothetical protein